MIATVLAICGSARSGSVNQKLLAYACVALGKHDVTINSLDLHALDLPIYDADLEEERGQPEAVDRLRRAISQADGLLIASPEYNHSIAPLLKNAIDWVSHPIGTGGLAGEELRTAAAQGIARSAFAIAGGIVLTLLIVIGSRTDKPAAEAADLHIISNGERDHAA